VLISYSWEGAASEATILLDCCQSRGHVASLQASWEADLRVCGLYVHIQSYPSLTDACTRTDNAIQLNDVGFLTLMTISTANSDRRHTQHLLSSSSCVSLLMRRNSRGRAHGRLLPIPSSLQTTPYFPCVFILTSRLA
jgi:hypothetical protein